MSHIYEPQATCDNRTAAGGHKMMQDIGRLLLGVGLSRVNTSPGYDPAGPQSQAPTAYNTYSAPMVFAFADSRQAADPVYIVLRLGFGNVGGSQNNSSQNRYAVECTVCTQVSGAGEPGGAVMTNGSLGGYTNSQNAAFETGAWGDGHMASYSGDALTLFLGRRAFKSTHITADSYGGNAFRSAVWLHVERKFTAAGAADAGFVALSERMPLKADVYLRGRLSSSAALRNNRLSFSQGSAVVDTESAFERAGGDLGLFAGTTPVVAPIYYPGQDGPVPMRQAFTVAAAAFSGDGGKVRLDFTGAERDYLSAVSDYLCTLGRTDLAFLYGLN